ncbi:MAG: MBL fold metallo-hydrolase, partial [Chloroflexota bacterium]
MNRKIGHVKNVRLTVLVDNKADLIVKSNETVKYFTEKPLIAEHGYSVLVDINEGEKKILWDAGVSKETLVENMHRMGLNPKDISMIALSHGHFDHYAGMTKLLNEMRLSPEAKEWGQNVPEEEVEKLMREHQIPIVAHPAAYRERWRKKDDGSMVGPFPRVPQQAWAAAGAEIVHSEEPYQLAEGCWVTGYIPRKSFETIGRPTQLHYRQGSEFLADDLEEDQAIVINVKGKGLIVLSACAHAGIVNTVHYAKAFTGIER